MLDIHTGLGIWTVIIFLLLLAILYKLAWKPILAGLDERTRTIRDSLQHAEHARKEAERAKEEYEKMMAAARLESQELIAKGRKTAESVRQELVDKAQKEAETLMERAKREIGLEREKALEEIKRTAGELSINIATKIISKSLSAKDHQDLIRQALLDMRPLMSEPN